MNVLFLIGLTLLALLSWVYYVFKKNYQLWRKLDVPHLKPTFPYGNVLDILKSTIHFAYIMENRYKDIKAITSAGYGGIYFFKDPVLVVTDPEFAKTIMVKDFNYFVDRGVYSNEKGDPLSANLFFLEGQKWKDLRAKLTPTFTSGKLKMMFHTIVAVGEELDKYLQPIAEQSQDVDIRDILGRFMTDIIGSCAFGIDCNSLENPNSKFRVMGKQMISFPKPQALKIFFAMMFRDVARKFNVRFNTVEVADFFMGVVRETINYREQSKVRRKDFMQLLLDLKDKGVLDEEDASDEEPKGVPLAKGQGLTFEEIAAQAFVFFFAGFETSATTMTYALHLLAMHPEIQEKGREEVSRVLDKYDGKFTYDGVVEMVYIENIIKETLRLYPPVATLHRCCLNDYKLPNGSTLPKGIGVVIPILAMHRDADHFPDPMRFDPDRFTNDAKATRHPFSYLPFGEGPRICIGMRFGLLQTKLGLAMLLKNFKFNVCDKTEIPLKIDAVNLIHTPLGEVYLNIQKC